MRISFGCLLRLVGRGLLVWVLTVAAQGLWAALLLVNLARSPARPWAVAVAALLLWVAWQYLGGHWGPRGTAMARHAARRATALPLQVFAWAIVAGALALAAEAGL